MKRTAGTGIHVTTAIATLAALVITLTGCQTTSSIPLTEEFIDSSQFNTSMKTWLRGYMKFEGKKAAAVTLDGRHGSSYFYYAFAYGSSSNMAWMAKHRCEKRTGKECFIYALNNQVVSDKFRNTTTGATPVSVGSSEFRYSEDIGVCRQALTSVHRPIGWDTSPKYAAAVVEAKHRGLTLGKCAMLTGRWN